MTPRRESRQRDPENYVEEIKAAPEDSGYEDELDSPITSEETMLSVERLNSRQAPGDDDILNESIKGSSTMRVISESFLIINN